jgi:glycolate oxidase FAD binding subunit
VLPRPETQTTLLVAGLDDDRAVAALCEAMGTPWEVSGAAHLPKAVMSDMPEAESAAGGGAATLIRLEGFGPSVAYRAEKLAAALRPLGRVGRLDGAASAALWMSVRDAEAFAASMRPVWRVSVAPSAGPRVASTLQQRHAIRHFYDWSGGLVWIEASDEEDALASEIRAAVAAAGGGHATLIRGSAALRASVPPFEPQPPALAALSRRLKEQFDPRGILNPGRMVAGI